MRFPSPLSGGKRGRRVSPSLMSDVDRVWLAAHHPSVGGDLLHEAAHLAPKDAAAMLLHHLPQSDTQWTLGQRLDCIGIAVGRLSSPFAVKGRARSLWRSTLPVLLVTDAPFRKSPSAHEIAEQVGYLIYGSETDASSHEQVKVFAGEFEHGFSHA